MTKGLLKLTGDPATSKDPMLAKMARIPKGYTHIGIANTELGLTVVVASEEWFRPLVFDPIQREWSELKTKTAGGLVLTKRTSGREMPS